MQKIFTAPVEGWRQAGKEREAADRQRFQAGEGHLHLSIPALAF